MATLTKKYRLIWNDNKELLTNPYYDHGGTITRVGAGRHSFETNDIDEVEQKINQENLTYNESDI